MSESPASTVKKPANAKANASANADTSDGREQVQSLLERMRPAVQADGGDIEFVDLTRDGVVKVRLHGACVGCPSSSMTLQMGIQRNLVQRVPSVTAVKQVD